jgi:hypothetical protein
MYHNAMKQCKKCGATKEIDQFNAHPTNLDGRSGHCRECQRKYSKGHHNANKQQYAARYKRWANANRERVKKLNKEWVANNGPKLFEYHIKKTYGISIAEYNAMLQDQGHKCKICPTLHSDTKRLHIDHDHKTGSIRGLLCHWCNHMLGAAKDNPITLANAIAYLENNSHNDPPANSIPIDSHLKI